MHKLRVLVAICASSCLPAQIAIVDAANGPGANFTDIQSAIDAAAPAGRISVRSGLYSGFTIDKPVAVNAEDGVLITAPNSEGEAITVRNLPAGTNTVVGNFWMAITAGGGLNVESCSGRVLLDELLQLTRGNVAISDCVLLLCNRSHFTPGLHVIQRSTVTLTNCTFRGRNDEIQPTHGLSITDSTVTMSRCIAVGGSVPSGGSSPGAGLELSNTQLTLTGDGTGVVAAGSSSVGVATSAVRGNGSLVLDPDVVLRPTLGAPDVAATVLTTSSQIPSLASSGTALGELASVDVHGTAGDLYVVLLSRLDDPLVIPALGGEAWLNPATIIVAFGGVLDSDGHGYNTIAIQTLPGLFGLPVAWIAATGPQVSTLRFSNNAGFTYWM